jgi:hypothetical protein
VLGVHTHALEHIGQRLAQDLDDARREHAGAKERFIGVMREVPSGFAHPDDAFRLLQAGKETRHALEVYSKALDRYSNFVLHGVVPDDLKSSGWTLSD